MFCGCDARYWAAEPNSHVCPVDLGLPGALPVVNEEALEKAAMAGMALNCAIAEFTRFDRKNYPYPDIPKGYQISQYDHPIATRGYLDVELDGRSTRVGLVRAHLEEDTGKTIHSVVDEEHISLVDFNRSGVPLLEIVTEPDLQTAEEARAFFMQLREILVFLGVNSGDMQEGALRADVNVSVAAEGERGTKVEIKNLNSFRSVAAAIEFEIGRQSEVVLAGGRVAQETRGWDDSLMRTVGQRSKEYAQDYRYFPEPDLPPLRLDAGWVAQVRTRMPELPRAKRARFVDRYRLSAYDASVLTQDPAIATLLDETVRLTPFAEPKLAANWISGEFLRLVNASGSDPATSNITAEALAGLIRLVADGTISNAIAKTVFEEMFETGRAAEDIVRDKDLAQVDDREELRPVVRKIIEENAVLVADYVEKARKTEGPLVGKIMAATRGKANPTTAKEILAEELEPS
jgi:aspartyl-tRNA(Asn)/glutamyl-tRNA(Gln) amidotransferase subunit B